MATLAFLIFLVALSTLTLLLLASADLLKSLRVSSGQRVFFLKLGLSVIAIAPVAFLILKKMSFKSLEMQLSPILIDTSNKLDTSLLAAKDQSHWSQYALWVYTFIVVLGILRMAIAYFNTQKKLESSWPVKIQNKTVYLSSEITSPFSFGFPETRIYFPADINSKWTSREIEMSLTHEQIHIRHSDNSWKLISLLLRTFLFFAPWAHAFHRRFELEMEIYCDEQTCRETNADLKEYGSLLLAMVCQKQFKYSLVTNMTDSTLKRRILAMKSRTIQRPFTVGISTAILLLISSVGIAATSGITEKRDHYRISSTILLNGKLLSKPRLEVVENEPAYITQTNHDGTEFLKLELTVNNASTPNLPNGIGINFDIHYSVGGESDHIKPQVILAPSKEGTIQVGAENGQLYEMQVLVERR